MCDLPSTDQAALHRARMWIERVATDDNISDLPSREEYAPLKKLGAQWRPPMLAELLLDRNLPLGTQSCLEP